MAVGRAGLAAVGRRQGWRRQLLGAGEAGRRVDQPCSIAMLSIQEGSQGPGRALQPRAKAELQPLHAAASPSSSRDSMPFRFFCLRCRFAPPPACPACCCAPALLATSASCVAAGDAQRHRNMWECPIAAPAPPLACPPSCRLAARAAVLAGREGLPRRLQP